MKLLNLYRVQQLTNEGWDIESLLVAAASATDAVNLAGGGTAKSIGIAARGIKPSVIGSLNRQLASPEPRSKAKR